MRLVRSARRWSFVTVETVDQLERVALLNAQLERDIATELFGQITQRRSRLVAVLSTVAVLLASWNTLTLLRGLHH